jgi:hypothetical protein
MSNETVRTTLNQMLYKYAAQRGDILGKIQDSRIVLDDAEANLKRAHEDDRRAIHDDDQLVIKMRDLMAYYNSLPNDPPRPQALLEQHAEMGREQLGTHRKRIAAHEVVSDATHTLEDAKRELAIAERDEKTISERIRETNAEIERLNQQP